MLYTEDQLGTCNNRYYFGKSNLYKEYKIINTKIVGVNRCEKQGYIIVNDDKFLNETKKIGKILFNFYGEYLTSFSYKDNNSPYIIKDINLKLIPDNIIERESSAILEIIYAFVMEYGLPFDFSDNTLDTECNSNELSPICSAFLLIYMIPILCNKRETEEAKSIKKIFKINLGNYDEITWMFNNDIAYFRSSVDFKFRYINNIPIFISHNLFSFAFRRLMFSIIDNYHSKGNKVQATNVCKNCGTVLSRTEEKYDNQTRIRAGRLCDKCKKSPALRSADSYTHKKEIFENIKYLGKRLKDLDKDKQYTTLIKQCQSIKNAKSIHTKSEPNHIDFKDELQTIVKELENNQRKNNRN